MADFMMLMKGTGPSEGWEEYIEKLQLSGIFRGGSVLANGISVTKAGEEHRCSVTGFMRFEAESIDEIKALLEGNPVYESGGTVELAELVRDTDN